MKFCIFLISFLIFSWPVLGDSLSVKKTESFSRQEWKKASKDFEYKDPLVNSRNKRDSSGLNFGFLKYPAYALVIIGLGYLLYFLIRNVFSPGNSKVKSTINAEQVNEEKFDIDTDLTGLLNGAIARGDFRMAVRLSYLICLKELASKELIVLSREKTNYEYLSELASHPAFSIFHELTSMFERSWFGEIPVNERSLSRFNEKYNFLMNKISSSRNNDTEI